LDELEGGWVAAESFLEIHAAVVAEGGDQLAGSGVESVEDVIGGEEQAAVGTVLTLPVIDAAVRYEFGRLRILPGPDFLTGGGVEGDDGVVLGEDVEGAVDGDGLKEYLFSSAVEKVQATSRRVTLVRSIWCRAEYWAESEAPP